MDNMGAVFGIIVSILLLNVVGIRALFALAAIPSFLGAGLIFFRIREKRDGEGKIFKGMAWRDLDANIRRYILANAVFALGARPPAGTLMLVRGPELWHAAQLKYRLIEGESWGDARGFASGVRRTARRRLCPGTPADIR